MTMRLLLVWLLLTTTVWADPMPKVVREDLPDDLTTLTQDERNDAMKEALQLKVYDRLIKRGLMTEDDERVQRIPRKKRAKLREKDTLKALRQSMRTPDAPRPTP